MVNVGDKVIFSTNVNPKPPISPPQHYEEGKDYIVTMIDNNDFTYKLKKADDDFDSWNGYNWIDQAWFKPLSQIRKEKMNQIEGRVDLQTESLEK